MAFSGCWATIGSALTTQNYTGGGSLPFNSEWFDVGGWHDNASNNDRLTVPSGVSYVIVNASVSLANLTANMHATLTITRYNSSNAATGSWHNSVEGFFQPYITCSVGPISVSAGDYFKAHLTIETDTSITIDAGSNFSIYALPAPETYPFVLCYLNNSGGTGINFTGGVSVPFQTEFYDTGGFHDAGANTRITIPAGVNFVELFAHIYLSNFTADNFMFMTIRHFNSGGSQIGAFGQFQDTGLTDGRACVHTPMVQVSAGDYFDVFVQTEGDTSVDYASGSQFFAAMKVG